MSLGLATTMWPDSTETKALLEQAGAGDAAAVERLLDRHREPLRTAVRMRLDRAISQRVDASDVVQDVLLEASERLSEFLGQQAMPFRVWLRRLAQDRMIDLHRRHRKASRRTVDREQALAAPAFADRSSLDLAGELADPHLTPAADAIRRELTRRFHAALDTLDEGDREILILRHVEQLSNSEAAALLDLSPAAAGMRHLRALRRLRQVLGERPSGDSGVAR